MRRNFVGTSGWMYRQWKEGWYGKEPQRRWLAFCAERFTSIEIDGTFYGSKPRSVFEKWADETPEGFCFAVRGHRFVSHFKHLKDVRDSLQRLREQAEGLGDKLGPILWQTPPRMKINLDRLKSFAEDLSTWDTAKHVLEFRNETWFVPEVKAILKDARVAICVSDGETIPCWKDVSADFTYVRLHGRPQMYWSDYTASQIREWTELIEGWPVREVYAYFDNDAAGQAPHDALKLLAALSGKS